MFKRVALSAAAALAIAAPIAAAHTVTSKADCTSANFNFTLFGPTTLNTLNWSVTVNGVPHTGVVAFTGANGSLNVPTNVTGSATIVTAVTGRTPDGFTVNYVSAPVPVSCPVPAPPVQPQYNPPVDTPNTLPAPTPTPVVPVPKKALSCLALLKHHAGRVTLLKHGCIHVVKTCPVGKVKHRSTTGNVVCIFKHQPVTG